MEFLVGKAGGLRMVFRENAKRDSLERRNTKAAFYEKENVAVFIILNR
jgi:hypothetical protein